MDANPLTLARLPQRWAFYCLTTTLTTAALFVYHLRG